MKNNYFDVIKAERHFSLKVWRIKRFNKSQCSILQSHKTFLPRLFTSENCMQYTHRRWQQQWRASKFLKEREVPSASPVMFCSLQTGRESVYIFIYTPKVLFRSLCLFPLFIYTAAAAAAVRPHLQGVVFSSFKLERERERERHDTPERMCARGGKVSSVKAVLPPPSPASAFLASRLALAADISALRQSNRSRKRGWADFEV